MRKRALPSEIDRVEETAGLLIKRAATFAESVSGEIFLDLCFEIRACWAEIELLRPIALAAAEESTLSPATESPLFAAVSAWHEWQRGQMEKSEGEQ